MNASDLVSNIRSEIATAVQSPKTAAGVSTLTTGTGVSTMLDWIPNDIGKLATLVGIILSLLLIYVHLLAVRKAHLEIAHLKRQADEWDGRERRMKGEK